MEGRHHPAHHHPRFIEAGVAIDHDGLIGVFLQVEACIIEGAGAPVSCREGHAAEGGLDVQLVIGKQQGASNDTSEAEAVDLFGGEGVAHGFKCGGE